MKTAVAVYEYHALGLVAYNCKCLTCGWLSDGFARESTAVRHAKAHRCKPPKAPKLDKGLTV
jgi:hypothetical protein